jgi:hypothetical protein
LEALKRERRKPSWPAALDRVVAVGSADHGGERSVFTPADVDWIDILAVGNGVVSTFLDGRVNVGGTDGAVEAMFNGFAQWGGTSFAAGTVAGAIAALTEPGRRSTQDAFRQLVGPPSGTRPRFRDIRPAQLVDGDREAT